MEKKIRRKRMSKKIKNRRRRFFFFLFVFMFLVVIFVGSKIKYKYKNYEVTSPKVTLYRDVVKGKGYLLLDEEIVKSKGTGIAIYNVQEGAKVPRNYLVANVNLMQDNSKIKDELIQVQAAIDYKNDDSDVKEENISLSKEEINIIRNIQRFIRDKSYEKLIASINSLDLHTKHTVNISELNELLKLSLEDLEDRKEKLSKELSTTDNEYIAESSGIVSYTIDDASKHFSMDEDLSKYTENYLESSNIEIYKAGNKKVKGGQPFYRIINNLEWYIALVVPDKRLLSNIDEDRIRVKMDDGDIISGQLIGYNGLENDKGVAILRFQDKLTKYYPERLREVTIIKSESDAFTIPSSSLVENEKGTRGVYIQEIHGLVQFVPVDVIAETREEAYISRGDKDGYIRVGEKNIQTLSIHDDVIIDPNQVESRQIVY